VILILAGPAASDDKASAAKAIIQTPLIRPVIITPLNFPKSTNPVKSYPFENAGE
jgi:hypothetical protein